MASFSAIAFNLSALDNDVVVEKALISADDTSADNNNNPKGIANLYVSRDQLRNVFRYGTNAADLTDVSDEDLRFYVDATGFADLSVNTQLCVNTESDAGTLINTDSGSTLVNQITRAWISGTENVANDYDSDAKLAMYTVDNKSLIKDLFRDLANQMFGTQYGVDIFQNESDICDNTASNTAVLFQSGGNIWNVLDVANEKTGEPADASNIGQLIFRNIMANDADRFADVVPNFLYDISVNDHNDNQAPGGIANDSGSGQNNTEMSVYQMPFENGDTLFFHLNYKYDADQSDVLNLSKTYDDRLYKIILHVTDTF